MNSNEYINDEEYNKRLDHWRDSLMVGDRVIFQTRYGLKEGTIHDSRATRYKNIKADQRYSWISIDESNCGSPPFVAFNCYPTKHDEVTLRLSAGALKTFGDIINEL